MVTSPCPGGGVRRGEEGRDFVGSEELDDGPGAAFGWDREDLGDGSGVLGMVGQSTTEDRADRSQSGVAGLGAVASFVFEVVKEPGDVRRGDGLEVERLRGNP